MPNYIFWTIEWVDEGAIFENRIALREAGIHLATVAGIDWNGDVWCPSIVLNWGYIDDFDEGNVILYTWHGWNDPSTWKQIKDQSWDAPWNKALLTSEFRWLPVRVTRWYNHKSAYSPKDWYVYWGLYSVVEHFEETWKNGFRICRYKLIKDSNTQSWLKTQDEILFSEWSDGKKRIETTTLRILRDTKLARQIKEEYNYTCQICWLRIESHGVGYAEWAHIRPLWKPHNWTDTVDNLLCLCPNHHVMFDKWIFSINDDLSLNWIKGKIFLSKNHGINQENLKYQREHIYID